MQTNQNKIAFIICTNDSRQLEECLVYLNSLRVPEGMDVDILTIEDAESMCAGYNEGMNATDAKYKVYLHQDVFIVNPTFISDVIRIFRQDPKIGMIGMVGAEKMSRDGVMWHEERFGDLYKLEEFVSKGLSEFTQLKKGLKQVEVIDGLMMITQYDIPWREDVFKGWDFYDASQSTEFRKAGYDIVVPAQNPTWTIHACGVPSFWNYEKNRRIFVQTYPEVAESRRLRILFVGCSSIALNDIAVGLTIAGHNVEICSERPPVHEVNPDMQEKLEEIIEEFIPDVVLSYDFICVLAAACNAMNCKYLAWVYDSPQFALYTKEALLPTNYIFCFDRKQVDRLREIGVRNIYHTSLATNFEILSNVAVDSEDAKRYGGDVSFVGRLYDNLPFDELFLPEDSQTKEKVYGLFEEIKDHWSDENGIVGRGFWECVEVFLRNDTTIVQKNLSLVNEQYYVESLRLVRRLNYIERVDVLNYLAQSFDVYLYTDDEDVSALKGVKVRPRVSYTEELPKVNYLSKINLNITSRGIESGIPQRVFDIMAVGGFVLTNYQPELAEFFDVGNEIEVYHDLEELGEKVAYYLAHEKERKRIALNGYRRVQRDYSYSNLADKAVRRVFEA